MPNGCGPSHQYTLVELAQNAEKTIKELEKEIEIKDKKINKLNKENEALKISLRTLK